MIHTEDGNKSLCSKTKVILEIDAFPFKGLKISENWKKLDSIKNRSNCSMCKKSRKYFCYTCYVAVPEAQQIIPILKLPVKVDIIKHAREMDGKSTAVHAAVLAPEDVRIFTYPCIPDYGLGENVVLVFPNNNAVSVQEICENFFREVRPLENKRPRHQNRESIVHRVVFIDSTWNQSRGIFKDPRIKALPSVVLRVRLSQFWRHQADSPRWYLATVEAIHQFLVELDAAQWHLDHRTTDSVAQEETETAELTTNMCNSESLLKQKVEHADSIEKTLEKNDCLNCGNEREESLASDCKKNEKYSYSGKYDDILFFFRFMYSKIHSLYDHDQLRSYKRRLE